MSFYFVLTRTFRELSRPEDLYVKCQELCKNLAGDLIKERLIVRNIFWNFYEQALDSNYLLVNLYLSAFLFFNVFVLLLCQWAIVLAWRLLCGSRD